MTIEKIFDAAAFFVDNIKRRKARFKRLENLHLMSSISPQRALWKAPTRCVKVPSH